MHRHFKVVMGDWMVEDWHLYRWRSHHAARQPSIRWMAWDRVL